MKKVFFGLLIVAAGAGVFFYLQNQKKTTNSSANQQTLPAGNQAKDSLAHPDPARLTGADSLSGKK